jgi:RHS repeat-associated protein
VTTFFYAWDHLGTIRLVSNPDRTLLERHDYEPFGVELRPILNQTQNTHEFTGHERDQASEYDYMHYRYYGSTLGRFLKPDNIPGNLANPQSWDLYSYVHGNPVNFNDPTGHVPYSYEQRWNPDRNSDMGLGGDQRPDPGSDYYIHTSSVYLNGELYSAQATVSCVSPGPPGSGQNGNSGPIEPELAKLLQEQVMKGKGEVVFDIFASNGKQSAWWTYDINKDGMRYMNAVRGEAYDLAIRVGVAMTGQGADWIALGHAHPEGTTNISSGFYWLDGGATRGAIYRTWKPGVSPEDKASYPGIAQSLQRYAPLLPHLPALGVLDTNRNWIPYPFN